MKWYPMRNLRFMYNNERREVICLEILKVTYMDVGKRA